MRIIFLLALLCPYFSNCQPITIKGRIINAQSEPVADATITIKRTGESTVSGKDGKFEFAASQPRDTLVVTAVGYEAQSVPNNERGLHTIILREKTSMLDEVIINTGYQQIPRERSTGSFTIINNDLLSQQFSTGIIERLNGITNSIQFLNKLDGPDFTVRGLSTIQGPTQPLVIIDNFPFEGDLNNINPADVESITILKDAAASSIWGTRAGNGVVVITTKKGVRNSPLKVNFTASTIYSEVPDLFVLPSISSSDYIDVEQLLFEKNYYNSNLNSRTMPALTPVVEILAQKRAGLITEAEAESRLNVFRHNDIRNQYLEHFYQPALNQQYNFSFSGGSNAMSYYLSAGADKNISNLSAAYDRYTLRVQNSFFPSTKMQLNFSLFFTSSSSVSGRPEFNSILVGNRRVPYLSFSDEAGNPIAVAKNLRDSYTDTAGAGKLLNWKYYPLEDHKYDRRSATNNNMLGNLQLRYTIFPGIHLDFNYAVQKDFRTADQLRDENSYYARDLVNRFAQLNRATGVVKYIIPPGGILSRSQSEMTAHNMRSQINYNLNASRHAVAAIGGAELRQISNSGTGSAFYGYNPDVISTTPVDFVNAYPTFITGGSSVIPGGTDFSEKLNRFLSVFMNAAYTWNKKYTASFSARKDASNVFGMNANDRWNPLWSAGLSWNISRERFYKASALPDLKLRASFGYSGNVDPSKSAMTTMVYTSAAFYTSFPTAAVNQFSNPDLRWEKTKMVNIGADFHVFSNWNGSIEYYHKKGFDLFGTAFLDYTAGLSRNYLIKNVANMEANGIDFTMSGVAEFGKIAWRPSIVFNYNLAKTTRYYRTSTLARTLVNDGRTITPQEGQPLYSLVSYRWMGLDPASGNPVGMLDGKPSTDYNAITGSEPAAGDLVYSGSAIPRYFGNLFNSLSFKNFSLTANIVYKLGYVFRKQSISYNTLFSAGIGHGDFEKRWQKPGDEAFTYVPSLVYPLQGNRDAVYLAADVHTAPADHVRLKFVNLEYSLNRKGAKSKCRLQVGVQNVGILWRANKDHLDPDYQGSIPPTRSFTASLKLEL